MALRGGDSLGGFGADLDLLARGLQAFGADLQINPRLVDRLQRIFERQVAILPKLQLLIELLQRFLIRKLLPHGSTSPTPAPPRPLPPPPPTSPSTHTFPAHPHTPPHP